MRRKALLLANASAGQGEIRNKLFSVLVQLTRAGFEVTVCPIFPSKGITAEKFLEDCSQDYEVLLCSGGDGTLNHIVNWLLKHGRHVPVAFYPSGSTNDFARSLGITGSALEFCRAAAGGKAFACDAGRFNDLYFNYVAAFGAFTKVSYSTDQNVKNIFGYLAYLMQGTMTLSENLGFRCRMTVTHDGQREDGEYLFGAVCNTRFMGGMRPQLLKDAELDDGLFEVILVRASDDLLEIPQVLGALTTGDTRNPNLRVFSARSVSFRAEDGVDWTIDGEYGGRQTDVSIEVVPGAVTYLVSRTARNRDS